MKTIVADGMTFEEFLTPEEIADCVKQVADRINEDYEGREPLFICTLNGAFIFAADLYRQIRLHSQITFVRLKSYEGTSTTGEISELIGLQTSVEGKDVIVIEDIVDSGYTMKYFKQRLLDAGANTVAIASLMFKPGSLLCPESRPDYIGKEIPREFIIGCGFDLDDYERNHSSIYHLKNE